METILEGRGLEREYATAAGTVRALACVDVGIPAGRLTLVRGPSGSGKSTLLNVLGCLDRPTAGEVRLDGAPLSTASERARDRTRRKAMGFVFQSVALISSMTAFENVEFGLRVAGWDARTRGARAEECLAAVGLGPRMHHRPHELSGGEQQRVAVARAIAHKPRVVFADEPTAELDTHRGLQVVKLLRRLVEDAGITVVMSTHDTGLVDLADLVLVMEDGRLVDER